MEMTIHPLWTNRCTSTWYSNSHNGGVGVGGSEGSESIGQVDL